MIDISIRRRHLSVIIHTGLAFVLGLTIVAQAPAGFDLALVDVDGTKTVLGRLPPSTYAPRLSPDGRRIAFETRDRSGPDGARLWVAELSDLSARRALPRHGGAAGLGADVDPRRRTSGVHRVE